MAWRLQTLRIERGEDASSQVRIGLGGQYHAIVLQSVLRPTLHDS